MNKERAFLVVLGNVFVAHESGGVKFEAYANLDDYDTSQAVFINGDVDLTDRIVSEDKLILITGDYLVKEREV